MRILVFLMIFAVLSGINTFLALPILSKMRWLSVVESLPIRADGNYSVGSSGTYAVFCATEVERANPILSLLPKASGFQTTTTEIEIRGQDRTTGGYVKVVSLIAISGGTGDANDMVLDIGNGTFFKAGRFLGMKQSIIAFIVPIVIAGIESIFIMVLFRHRMVGKT